MLNWTEFSWINKLLNSLTATTQEMLSNSPIKTTFQALPQPEPMALLSNLLTIPIKTTDVLLSNSNYDNSIVNL